VQSASLRCHCCLGWTVGLDLSHSHHLGSFECLSPKHLRVATRCPNLRCRCSFHSSPSPPQPISARVPLVLLCSPKPTYLGAFLNKAFLVEASLVEASLVQAFLVQAFLVQASLNQASLNQASPVLLSHAKISHASLGASHRAVAARSLPSVSAPVLHCPPEPTFAGASFVLPSPDLASVLRSPADPFLAPVRGSHRVVAARSAPYLSNPPLPSLSVLLQSAPSLLAPAHLLALAPLQPLRAAAFATVLQSQ
jgi:hypothetical protein